MGIKKETEQIKKQNYEIKYVLKRFYSIWKLTNFFHNSFSVEIPLLTEYTRDFKLYFLHL